MAYFDVRISVGLWSVCCRFVFKINGIFWCQNLCRFMVGMLSVCYRFEFEIVGLLSVTSPSLCWWSVFNRCHVGYLSVSNRAIPYRILPDMNPTGFTVSSATLSVADSWPIQWKICVFCRFRVGLAGVTGVLVYNLLFRKDKHMQMLLFFQL